MTSIFRGREWSRSFSVKLAGVIGLAMAVIAASLVTATPSSALSGAKRLLVVLCNFQNQAVEPTGYDRDYYRDMFSSQGDGKLGSYDFWRDVSYGQLTLDATVVGWYTIPGQRDTWAALDRFGKWKACVERAASDVHYEAFVGAVVIYPEAIIRTAAPVSASDTTVSVTGDLSNFPTPPFRAQIFDPGTSQEWVRVTAFSAATSTFTIERGQETTMAANHAANSWLQVKGADFFGGEPGPVDLGGTTYTLGRALGPHDISLAGMLHETGHLLGIHHSTAVSTFPDEYNDCYDTLSVYSSCSYMFDDLGGQFGGTIYPGYSKYGKGPGLNSLNVDSMGWLPADRKATFDNSSCRQQTYTMAALNRPGLTGIQQLRFTSGIPAFEYFAAELRDKSGWDRGIPSSAFVLHAMLADGRSMLIDRHPNGTTIGDSLTGIGALVAGEGYVNTTLGMYVGVNSIDNGTGRLTMGSCKLDVDLEYVGATSGQHSDFAVLSARLTVAGSSAPVPGATVRLAVGSKACNASTDRDGNADCSVVLDQVPGDYSATASYAGTGVYQAASDSATFTVEREVTELSHAGTRTSDYHDAFVAFGQLSEDDGAPVVGRTVSFTLGAGDSCTSTTSSAGVASCSITPTQPAATYTLSTSFAGDTFYQPSSDSDSFEVTHEESTTTNTGPTVLLAGTGSTATLKAQFVEDGANGDGTNRTAVPSGQTISFALGSESCTATTDASGVAQCTVNVPPSLALGPQPVTATFAGDAYYEPSSDSKDAIVFAFPSRGVFALGDNTVAAATPTSTMTWWSDAWWTRNGLSGGVAPDSFKGYATTVTTLPTTNPANSCGTTFRALPGNSPPPPSNVPSYMGVVVASSAAKSGNGINGTWGKIVVVKTDPGYSPKPGRTGTGRIVATFCQ